MRKVAEGQEGSPTCETCMIHITAESNGGSIPEQMALKDKGKGKHVAPDLEDSPKRENSEALEPRTVLIGAGVVGVGVQGGSAASLGPSSLSNSRNFAVHGGEHLSAGGNIYITKSSTQYREDNDQPPQVTSAINYGVTDASSDNQTSQSRRLTPSYVLWNILKLLRPNTTSVSDIMQEGEEEIHFGSSNAPKTVETYSRLMLKFQMGYPLYDPRPVQGVAVAHLRKGVRVGDVGRISPDGAFEFLFNVDAIGTAPADSPPFEGFETLQRIDSFKDHDFCAEGDNYLSDNVQHIGNAPVTYKFSGREGAVLQLPEGATYFGARNIQDFRDLAARHAERWYEYMNVNKSMDAPNGSLYLVTGCVKCRSCGTAVSYGPHSGENWLKFHSEGQSSRPMYRWEKLGRLFVRISQSEDHEMRQCVFIRGFRITLGDRPWYNLHKIAVPASSSQYDSVGSVSGNLTAPSIGRDSSTFSLSQQGFSSDSASQQDRLSKQNQVPITPPVVQALFTSASPMHPADFINPILLRLHPEAKAFLLHDDDWCRLLPKGFATSTIRLSDMLRSINDSYETVVDQYGCASLIQRTSQPVPSSNNDSQAAQAKPNTSESSISPSLHVPRTTISDELIPITDTLAQECPRFRILVVGRSGVGKSSLINAVFKTSFALLGDDRTEYADINKEITSPYNDRFVLHDSQGYEPGDEKKLNLLEKFIYERSRRRRVADRLHAIWLCISVPYAGGRIFETGDEKIFKMNRNEVPIIVVFTKYDLLVTTIKVQMRKAGGAMGIPFEKQFQELVAKNFEKNCIAPFKVLTKDIPEPIPYLRVSISQPDTLVAVVDVTMRNIHAEKAAPKMPSFSSLFSRNRFHSTTYEQISRSRFEDFTGSAQVALAAAQRVHVDNKIAASIRVGRQKYWSGLTSGMHFLNKSLAKCLYVLHKDIVTIWNIRDSTDHFLSDPFRARMTTIVEDLNNNADGKQYIGGAMGVAAAAATGIVTAISPPGPAAMVVGPVAAVALLAAWAYGVYHRTPANVRCLIGYIVDLTIIMQAVFRASLTNKEGNVDRERIKGIVDKFDRSEMKKDIHDAIRSFVHDGNLLAREGVVDKVEQLIHRYGTFSD